MCGFITRFQRGGRPIDDQQDRAFEIALQRLVHRGPDDMGIEQGYDWKMGFRRLSILDLTEASHQPMVFREGRFTLTFNGEIYNFRDLRARLPNGGWHSSGDTEVLGEWLLQRGLEDTLAQLRGMFAFVLWDDREKGLLAARDHFGIKPLYYSHLPNGDLVLGSEWRSVYRASMCSAEIHDGALEDYLRTGSVAGIETMVRGVKSVPPGHALRWQQSTGELHLFPYFDPRSAWSDLPTLSHGEALEATRRVFADSVKTHLVSDVPVGAFLSGGLDSSMMVALMRESGQSEIQAFSIGYEGEVGVPDETSAAQQTAQFYDCEFQKLSLNSRKLFDKFDGFVAGLDQPTGDGLNTYLVSELAATQVKTAISGLGADEWFAGYNYHRLILLSQDPAFGMLRQLPFSKGLMRELTKRLPMGVTEHKIWKALQYASGLHGDSTAQMQSVARTIFRESERATILSKHGARKPSLPESTGDWLKDLLLTETSAYLVDTLLRDNDFTSMAHSLELRVPCVDREVFALAGQIATSDKLQLGQGKVILRQAFASILPPWITDDRAKKTFTLPLMKWVKEKEWKEKIFDTLTKTQHFDRGLFQKQEVLHLLDAVYASHIEDKRAWRLTQRLWLLFVLESWMQQHLDS